MSIRSRFEDKVIHLVWTDCLAFDSGLNDSGYASFGIGKYYVIGAHRAAWCLAGHVIPLFHDLDHTCRNRWCVNVAHLEPVRRHHNLMRGLIDRGAAR